MCSDTFNPGGEVRGCCVGCILGMPDISPFVFIAASYQLHGISRTKQMFFQAGVFRVRRNFLVFCSDWHEIVVLFPLHLMPVFERCAAHRKPPLFVLCCKKQQQQQTPRAQQYTSSFVTPCAHGKLNVKHHRTTPKPAIHTSITAEKDEAALARK